MYSLSFTQIADFIYPLSDFKIYMKNTVALNSTSISFHVILYKKTYFNFKMPIFSIVQHFIILPKIYTCIKPRKNFFNKYILRREKKSTNGNRKFKPILASERKPIKLIWLLSFAHKTTFAKHWT